jgi:hypothetical protein
VFGSDIEALRETVDELLDADLSEMSDAVLADHTLALRREMDRLELAFAYATTASHRRGVGSVDGSASTAAWLRRHTGLPEGRARAAIEAGECAEVLPQTAAAWASGEISAQAARTIFTARVEGHDDQLRACEAELIALAKGNRPKVLLRAVRHFRDLATAGADEHELHDRRGLHLSSTIDGMTELDGTLDPETGEVARTALQAFTDPPSDGDTRTPAQRRADGFKRMCEAALSTLESDAGPTRARPHVSYLVSHETVTAGKLGACDGEFVGPVGRETMRRLLCDCEVSRIVTGPGSVILDAGRTRRVVTAAQRRAVVARDQGCRFPGCDRPPGWCEVHHLKHWLDGGRTDLCDLILLCDHHHTVVHRDGLILVFRGTDIVAVYPDGLTLAV